MNRTLVLTLATLLAMPALRAQETDPKELRKQALAAWQDQKHEEAIPLMQKVVAANPKDGLVWHHLGYSLHMLGKFDQALEAHIQASAFPSVAPTATYNAACVYALKKDKDKAFEWLHKAINAGFRGADHMDNDSDMDSLRDDPRYAKVVEAIQKAPPVSTPPSVFAFNADRASARIACFSPKGSPGQAAIHYGRPKWTAERAKYTDKFVGKRWRLGKDCWTTLDNNVPIVIGGKEFAPGSHYLVAELKSKNEVTLIVLDSNQIRQSKLDAFEAEKTTGGVEIPLQLEAAKKEADLFSIAFELESEGATKGILSLAWGPHRLTTPFELKIAKAER